MDLSLFAVIIAALLGVSFGSFLTVAVSRLGSGETIVRGRSHCPHCRKELRWFELLPLLSFFIQQGRCRTCGNAIPFWYVAVECILGAGFALLLVGLMQGVLLPPPFSLPEDALSPFFLVGEGAYYAVFFWFAVALASYDIRHRLIPGSLIWPLAALGILGATAGLLRSGDEWAFGVHLLSAGIAFLFFWLLWFLSRGRAMGRGDADVALAIVLCLGPLGGAVAILTGFWIGALYGIVVLALRRASWKSEIPFAPFLFGGALIAISLSELFLFLRTAWYGA